MNERIPLPNGEAVLLKESSGPCEIHDWPTEGLSKRLVDVMRARHGKGGIDVCADCVARAREDAQTFVRQSNARRQAEIIGKPIGVVYVETFLQRLRTQTDPEAGILADHFEQTIAKICDTCGGKRAVVIGSEGLSHMCPKCTSCPVVPE